MGRPFLSIPRPTGYERRRLIEAYFQINKNKRKDSKPLTPIMLNSTRSQLRTDLYNWIFLSVWFGLRPKEVDNLHDQDLWKIEKLFNGRTVLWVYQTKIVALPPEDRWKPIPILFDEQRFALRILKSGNFKRPISKTMKKYFGKGVDLYGGRKGFTDLMISKGQILENISIWMGHSTLNRTWKNYKSRKLYHLSY